MQHAVLSIRVCAPFNGSVSVKPITEDHASRLSPSFTEVRCVLCIVMGW